MEPTACASTSGPTMCHSWELRHGELVQMLVLYVRVSFRCRLIWLADKAVSGCVCEIFPEVNWHVSELSREDPPSV
jgi:hypothetical protein